jgi:hypothetical protein
VISGRVNKSVFVRSEPNGVQTHHMLCSSPRVEADRTIRATGIDEFTDDEHRARGVGYAKKGRL